MLPDPATPSQRQWPTTTTQPLKVRGKDTPETPAHTPPEKWRATGKKTKTKKQTQPKQNGPKLGHAAANTTEPRHE